MPLAPARISLRDATSSDRFIIRRWLTKPHVIAWWGSKASAEAEIAIAMDSPSALCRIIEVDGMPIGYAHAIDIGVWGSARPAELPAGSFDVDIFIGSLAHRGKGYGATALTMLRDEVFESTLAVTLGLIVSIKNEAAVRMIENAGFRWRAVIQDPGLGAAWLLVADRPNRHIA
jgi:aminoglycoside 6'-N-acetyltransferase